MFGKGLIAASLTLFSLFVTANVTQAQPSWPQGNGSVSGARSSSAGSSQRYYYAPTVATPGPTYESFYSPEPARSGWQERTDGWYFYWDESRLVGAYDPDSEAWHVYNAARGWGEATRPPWNRR